jgi:hypothetical protein
MAASSNGVAVTTVVGCGATGSRGLYASSIGCECCSDIGKLNGKFADK